MGSKKLRNFLIIFFSVLFFSLLPVFYGIVQAVTDAEYDIYVGMITETRINEDGREIVLFVFETREIRTFAYDDGEFGIGDFVQVVVEGEDTDFTTRVLASDGTWSWERSFEGGLEYENGILSINGQQYQLTSDAIIYDSIRSVIVNADYINRNVNIVLRGVDNYVWYVELHQGFGFIDIINVPQGIINLSIMISGEYTYLASNEPFRVDEGVHEVIITGDNIININESVSVEIGETHTFDLSNISINTWRLNLSIVDNRNQPINQNITLFIGDEQFDINEPIYIEFGRHYVRVEGRDIEPTPTRQINFQRDGQTEEITVRRVQGQFPIEAEAGIEIEIDEPEIVETRDSHELQPDAQLPLSSTEIIVIALVLVSFSIVIFYMTNRKRADKSTTKSTDSGSGDSGVGFEKKEKPVVIKAVDLESKYVAGAMNFTINEGSMIRVVGNSSSGKTALLKMLAGYDRDISGRLNFQGRTWKDNDHELRNEIGFVPQDAFLYKKIKPLNLLLNYSKLFNKEADENTINDILNSLGDEEESYKWNNDIVALSGGQQKRVSIAIELVREPRILILDEPDSGLDSKNRNKLYSKLHELCEKGITVIFSTHIDNITEGDEEINLFDTRPGSNINKDKMIKMYKCRKVNAVSESSKETQLSFGQNSLEEILILLNNMLSEELVGAIMEACQNTGDIRTKMDFLLARLLMYKPKLDQESNTSSSHSEKMESPIQTGSETEMNAPEKHHELVSMYAFLRTISAPIGRGVSLIELQEKLLHNGYIIFKRKR